MRRGNLYWGLALLLIGTLLLLDNLGFEAWVGISAWSLFWPLAAIALGIWILWIGQRAPKTFKPQNLVIPLETAGRAHVEVNFGAGELNIQAHHGQEMLLQGTFDEVEHKLKHKEDQLWLHLKTPIINLPFYWTVTRRRWDFSLCDTLALDLTVQTGASDNHLDLSALQLKNLHIQFGASATRVSLPAHAGHTTVRASSGAASLDFYVPEGVAAQIHTSGALHSTNIDTARFPKQGNAYQSPDYETATNRIDLHVDMGVGSVSIS